MDILGWIIMFFVGVVVSLPCHALIDYYFNKPVRDKEKKCCSK